MRVWNPGSFVDLLASLAEHFAEARPDSLDHEIGSALERIGLFLEVDRVVLSEFRDQGDTALVRHSWASAGVEPVASGRRFHVSLPRIFAGIRRGEVVSIPDTRAIPADWEAERQEFARSSAKSHVSLPFSAAGLPVGVLSAVAVHEARPWSDREIRCLRMLSQVFCNALSRRNLEEALRRALAQIEDLKNQGKEGGAGKPSPHVEIGASDNFEGVAGSSAAMKHVLAMVDQVAPTFSTVLILGETGTGKDLVARAIHAGSARRDRPVVRVNCAALPSTLAESELFGHEKGAFTGALRDRTGRFELADGGTLFLDEVGDLSLETQAKLLRVLQDGEFERLGSSRTRSVDVRVIAATSKNLGQAVADGRFRADLFYRLSVVPIEMPPLRDRREDIPALVSHFIQKGRARGWTAIERIPAQTMEALVASDWPGNVRELENAVERALVLSPGVELVLTDPPAATGTLNAPTTAPYQPDEMAEVERSHIIRVLDQCNWKVKGAGNAAERLGLNPSTLRARMQKLGIERPRPRLGV